MAGERVPGDPGCGGSDRNSSSHVRRLLPQVGRTGISWWCSPGGVAQTPCCGRRVGRASISGQGCVDDVCSDAQFARQPSGTASPWSGVESAAIQPPLFLPGVWRSGTTHLQNQLCKDDRFGFPNTFHALNPDTFLSTERSTGSLHQLFHPATRPFDNIRMESTNSLRMRPQCFTGIWNCRRVAARPRIRALIPR